MINVVLIEDAKIFRRGIKFILKDIEDIHITAEYENGKLFLNDINNVKVDVILMDIAMPEMDGEKTTIEALKIKAELKILALSMFSDEKYFYKMVHAGVLGFVNKESTAGELIEAIKKIYKGENYFSQILLKSVFSGKDNVLYLPEKAENLNSTEFDLVKEISTGKTLSEISHHFDQDVAELQKILNDIYNKTNTTNEASLIMFALKNNLINI